MAAASHKEEFKNFEYSDNGYCNGGDHKNISNLKHGHHYKLNVFCIDLAKELEEDFSEDLPKLKMIKIDTEGYDYYVLQTISNIINKYQPIIKAEIYKKTDLTYRKKCFNILKKTITLYIKYPKNP